MGQSISVHLTRADEKGHQQHTIEQIRLIQQVLIENCKTQAKKMKELALNDQCFPIVAVVGQTEKFFVQAENVASEEIERHVSGVIHSEFIGGFINIMSALVNELLEDTSATEQERSGSHVVFANSSFLRVNYYLYKYEFSCKSHVQECCLFHDAGGITGHQKYNLQPAYKRTELDYRNKRGKFKAVQENSPEGIIHELLVQANHPPAMCFWC